MYEQKAQFGVIDDPSYISILNSSDDDDGLQLKFYVFIYFLKYFCLSHKPSRNIKNVYVADHWYKQCPLCCYAKLS